MTPSNPDNQQPLIYRIADSLGVFHIVAPVNHTHAQSEVEGLVAALAAKANAADVNAALASKQDSLTFDSTPTEGSTNPVTSGGIKAALDGKAPNNYVGTMLARTISGIGTTKVYIANPEDRGLVIRFSIEKEGEEELEAEINENNIGNLIRALVSPDATPTADSDNLVTSGGVKAALESKANKVDVEYQVFEKGDASENIKLDTIFSDGHETSHFVLINRMGEQIKVSDFFYTQYGELVENGQTLSADSTAIVKIIHYNDGSTHKFFMVVEEIYEA